MKIFLLIFISFLLSGCSTNPVTGNSDFVLLSEDQELSMGRKNHQEIIKEYGVYKDPVLQKYIQEIGSQLAEKSHRNNLIYRFTLLDSDVVNAFALPGGYIYITRGLLAFLNSEDELAAVLGHEIGHVTARHSVRQISAQQAAGIGVALGQILVPELRGQGGDSILNLLGTALIKGYGREHELEADRLGAEYLARTGRNPEAMLNVIRVLKNQELLSKYKARQEGREVTSYHGLFASHPDNDKRLKSLIKEAGKYKKTNYTGASRNNFLSRLKGLSFGPSAEQGVLRGDRFLHSELGFGLRFPANWHVRNKPDKLIAASPQNDAIFQMSLTDMNRKLSPENFMIQRLGKEDLQIGRHLDLNGLPAYSAYAPTQTPWGERLARYTVVYFNQQAYIFIYAAKNKRDPQQYDQLILNSLHSFHPLTPGEVAQAKPLHINLLKANATTRYTTLARQSALSDYALETLRILNDDYPDGEPAAGKWLKILK